MKRATNLLGGMAFVSFALPGIALAADAAATAGGELQEIVVTAQKRAEDLDKVPLSITAFDQAQMDRQGIRDFNDIVNITPGIDLIQRGPNNDLAIRGVQSSAGSATTGIYIDDVPVQVRVSQLSTEQIGAALPKVFDLDHVEVLRGPQGTLFGAGAEGGAVLFVTPNPSLTANGGYARAGFNGVENGGIGYELGAAVGGPMVDNVVGFRVSAWHEEAAGFIDHYSVLPGGVMQADSNWTDSDVLRAALVMQPIEGLRITPSVYFQNIYAHDQSSFSNNTSDPSRGTLVNPLVLPTPLTDRWLLPSLKAEFDMGHVRLTSITAYFDRDQHYIEDYTFVTPALLGLPSPTSAADYTNIPYRDHQGNFSQELRLQSTDPSARLNWTIGAWFLDARQHVSQWAYEPGLPQEWFNQTGMTLQQTFGEGLLPGGVSYTSFENTLDTQRALFGQLDFRVVGGLSLTAGARIADQYTSFLLQYGGPLGGNGPPSVGNQKETDTTPKFGVNYQVNDDNLFYASAAKGNRMGGANPAFLILPGCLQQLAQVGVSSSPGAFESDYVWSYEVGSKNKLMNGALRIEGSIFHLDWTNLQTPVFVPACATSFTANVGKATSDGFDLALNGQVSDALSVGATIGYVNARIAQTAGVPAGKTFISKDDEIDPYHSPWTITGIVEYRFTVGGLDSYARVDDEFRSRNPGPFSFQDPNSLSYNPNQFVNPSINLLNFRVGTIIHGWDVACFAKNVANTLPRLYATADSDLVVPHGHAFTEYPRTVGLTAAYRW